jgi:hypothetical protein
MGLDLDQISETYLSKEKDAWGAIFALRGDVDHFCWKKD